MDILNVSEDGRVASNRARRRAVDEMWELQFLALQKRQYAQAKHRNARPHFLAVQSNRLGLHNTLCHATVNDKTHARRVNAPFLHL